MEFIQVKATELQSVFHKILLKYNFADEPARICAQVFTENSVDGVYSHGVNRFPKFVSMIKSGIVMPDQEATLVHRAGNLEQWDGQSAPGPINAFLCTDRAMELAAESGIGCVALGRTNHWMRGGTYAWRAARAGFVFIGWSNTIANTPAWGAINSKLGNNPLVIGIPFHDEAIVLDMAMSQYSYGALEMYQLKNERLPVPGGYDAEGQLTTDPAAIKKTERTLPIGYWKGAGLSLLLDVLGAVLSGGLSVSQISKQNAEHNLSQVFIAIDLKKLANFKSIGAAIDQIIDDYHESVPEKSGKKIRYPGEQVLAVRAENNLHGVPVIPKVWAEIQSL